jgi:starvation-inducible DNA-binding protein
MNFKEKNLEDITKMKPIGVVDEQKNNDMITFLNSILANEYHLFTKTLNYHWNFKGPRFSSMHKFLEEHYNQLLVIMDDTAERVKILDGMPLSTVKELNQKTVIPETPGERPSSSAMIASLIRDHHVIQEQIKSKIKEKDFFNEDPGSEDFLIGSLKAHEKMSWMLKSNLS